MPLIPGARVYIAGKPGTVAYIRNGSAIIVGDKRDSSVYASQFEERWWYSEAEISGCALKKEDIVGKFYTTCNAEGSSNVQCGDYSIDPSELEALVRELHDMQCEAGAIRHML